MMKKLLKQSLRNITPRRKEGIREGRAEVVGEAFLMSMVKRIWEVAVEVELIGQ